MAFRKKIQYKNTDINIKRSCNGLTIIINNLNKSSLYTHRLHSKSYIIIYLDNALKSYLYNLVFANGSSLPRTFFLNSRPYIFFFGDSMLCKQWAGLRAAGAACYAKVGGIKGCWGQRTMQTVGGIKGCWRQCAMQTVGGIKGCWGQRAMQTVGGIKGCSE